MINFIICDDNEAIRNEVVKVIDSALMKSNIEYKTHLFSDFDNKFMKITKDSMNNKVYVLDIETPTKSGIDAARVIREDDYDSVIIFLTSHNELGHTVLQSQFMFLDFINKFDDYKSKLSINIIKAIDVVGKRSVIRFNDRGTIYTIPFKDILYITKDSVERKTIIVTTNNEFMVNKTLIEISEMLSDSFKQTHRACFVNMERVTVFNIKKKIITFDNNVTIDLVSKTYKKGVK